MNPTKTIAVVCALKEELDYLLDKDNLNWGPLYTLDNKLQVRECSIDDYRIIIAHASGKMGLTESAILTTRVIVGCNPIFLAMIGVCGGFKKQGVNIGDVIVAEKSFHYQFGSFKNGCIQRELKVCEANHSYFTKIIDFLDDTEMSKIQTSSPRGMKKPETVLKVHCGPMASSDLIVKDETKLNEAEVTERKVIAVDMESYAVLRSASLLGVKALVIKSVSDFADFNKGADDDLREYAKYNASEALFRFILNEFNLATSSKKLKEKTEDITCNYKEFHSQYFEKEMLNNMILIPSGSVLMGDKKKGLHEIQIGGSLLVSKIPVTQGLYKKIMGENPSKFRGENLPIENITWFDAIEFCNKLSEKCGYDFVYFIDGEKITIKYDSNGFRLPTEAEWQYASCPDKFDKDSIMRCAWYMSNSGSAPHNVGQKDANPFGLYDMLGNVWEWCNDWYKPYDGSIILPAGPKEGENKVRKGGSWANFTNNLSPKYREYSNPNFSDNHIGFRVVKSSKS